MATRLNRYLLIGFLVLIAGCSSSPVKQPEKQEATNRIVIAAVGDVMLDASAREIMQREGYDFAFAKTKKWLTQADIAFANLEGPLTLKGERAKDKRFLFRSPPDLVTPALVDAGFDVFSIANNHTLDYGEVGLADTIAALDRVGLAYVGAGADIKAARKSAIIERNGQKIAFLAYSMTFPEEFWATPKSAGTAFGHEKHVVSDVKSANEIADIVIVSFHWGQEVKKKLRPYQISLGKRSIEAGAKLVIGHHPHILQAVEQYRDGVILYSLGNFAFGSYSQRVKTSALAEIEFRNRKVSQVRLIPLDVYNVNVLFQPTPLYDDDAESVIKNLQKLSSERGTELISESGVAVLNPLPWNPSDKSAKASE